MNERELKAKTIKAMRIEKGFVTLPHEDHCTSGIPDMTTTGFNKTIWWEFKHANPDFANRGIQLLTMRRLAMFGSAYYIVFREVGKEKSTHIVDPENIEKDITTNSRFWAYGFDIEWLVKLIKVLHNDNE